MEGESIGWDGWLEGEESGRVGWLEGELIGWDGCLEGKWRGRDGRLEGGLDDGEGRLDDRWGGECIVLGYGCKSCSLPGGALRLACYCNLFRALSIYELPLGPRRVMGFGRAGPRSASPSAASSSAGACGV